MGRRTVVAAAMVAAACSGGGASGTFDLPDADTARTGSAYIARVVADAEGDDLAEGAGEHVVLRHDLDIRNDLGGWWLEDAQGNRLNVGIGTQIDPGAELRVHTACGENSDEAVFNCLDTEVLDDDGDVLVLRDAAGAEVHRFAYGDAAE
ncbi:lamin tail domain-containing protein [Egicoccus sp. AB-alg6-2]|uniref:lamin tail domain-containing protein n=1 Tax=Egicoccus sp. AB-alg6-2 TaxID=3242692 RepID=UPI00359DDC13